MLIPIYRLPQSREWTTIARLISNHSVVNRAENKFVPTDSHEFMQKVQGER